MSASSSNTMNGLEELCEQYYIAGWLTTPQYEYYRHELQQNRVRMTSHSDTTGSTTTINSTNKLEIWKQQIQQSIKANAQMKQQQQQQHDESTQRSNETSTKYSSSSSVPSSESNGSMIYTPTEFQTHVILPSSSHNSNNSNSNNNNNKNINIKELFVEMCFYARLGYIQPPRCLHCTYTECYTGNTTASSSTTTLCHRYVIWRKDTNLVLDPDTIASNILILPCYLVQQLLNHSDDDDQQQQQEHRRLLPPPPNGNIPMRRPIESTNYLYDPVHTTIVRK